MLRGGHGASIYLSAHARHLLLPVTYMVCHCMRICRTASSRATFIYLPAFASPLVCTLLRTRSCYVAAISSRSMLHSISRQHEDDIAPAPGCLVALGIAVTWRRACGIAEDWTGAGRLWTWAGDFL